MKHGLAGSTWVALVLAGMIALPAVALAQGQYGYGPMGPGMMGGYGGYGGMGPGMMGGWSGGYGPSQQNLLTTEQAKGLAQQYADEYLKGFKVDKVLPFNVPMGTAYSVELKGPKDKVRVLHINPWGNAMPFGGPAGKAG